ncbi:hypothetical protein [Aquimarina mytili]|uniref:Cytochrome c domain-containing protein n=1 Tax=Aquimarina mytili TaxID=874423 RepID=A0A937D778_9FLAO|nr:hypothetical protein [Aquimarina mytili]MBL0685224.1 hypothetical protein [Aquimarina mytili]
MKLISSRIISGLTFIIVLSCNSVTNEKKQSIVQSSDKYVSTGGKRNGKLLCPNTVNDVIVTLNSLDSQAKPGDPEMTIKGILEFIQKNKINTIPELLNQLPAHYQNNFSLVEHTKGEGQSNLRFPRIVLFGPDGRFLMNISTKPDDPKHDLLDCAELNEETGVWEFSQFDFTEEEPKLHRSPESCIRCHGDKPRPVWGTNMDWPGVFGDNEAAGPNGEALSYKHVLRMREIIDGKTYSDRFDFLKWSDQKLSSGGIRRIADHAFGAELLISNMAMGTATARGVFKRMKNENPKKYKQTREALLLLGYEYMINGILSDNEKTSLEKVIEDHGGSGKTVDDLFLVLGIDTKEAFSLSTLAKEEPPKTNWSLGAGDLYEQVLLQILHDLAIDDHALNELLISVPNTPGIFGCKDLGKNIKEVIDFKMLHMHQLLGRSRYEVNKVYYSQDSENIKAKVFVPAYEKIVPYLKKKIGISNVL